MYSIIMKALKIFKKAVMALIISAIIFLLFWANMELVSINSLGHVQINVKNKVCYENFNDERVHLNKSSDLKMIYFITPTYPRPAQVPELTRLAHTLMHVPRIHWIIADDQSICSEVVLNILRRTGLPFTLISSPKPYVYTVPNFPRGVANRRAALDWLQKKVTDGVIYFGDDDNTVDLQLFDEIRNTKKVSMFPVGMIGEYGVSSPVVKDGKVVAFFDPWWGSRTFPVDMAGFAINIDYLKPTAVMPYIEGHEEDRFLVTLGLKLSDIEPLASNCSRVLVWHTKTAKYKKPWLRINIEELNKHNKYESFVSLLNEISNQGLATMSTSNGTRAFVIRNKKQYALSKIGAL